MMKRQLLAFFAVGFALLSGFVLAAGGFDVVAHDEDTSGTPTSNSPFMGMSAPDAP